MGTDRAATHPTADDLLVVGDRLAAAAGVPVPRPLLPLPDGWETVVAGVRGYAEQAVAERPDDWARYLLVERLLLTPGFGLWASTELGWRIARAWITSIGGNPETLPTSAEIQAAAEEIGLGL